MVCYFKKIAAGIKGSRKAMKKYYQRRYPYHEASAEEGRICFNLQVDGLVKLAREKLKALLGIVE